MQRQGSLLTQEHRRDGVCLLKEVWGGREMRQPEAEGSGVPSCESICHAEERREVLTTVSKAMVAFRLLTVCEWRLVMENERGQD